MLPIMLGNMCLYVCVYSLYVSLKALVLHGRRHIFDKKNIICLKKNISLVNTHNLGKGENKSSGHGATITVYATSEQGLAHFTHDQLTPWIPGIIRVDMHQ